MATQQVVPVSCPNCRFQFTAPVQSIINGQDPAQKAALLQGAVNIAQCPQCGFTDILSTPLLYYDLEKELAFVLAPNNLQLSGVGQEKIIGSLTNALMNSLPAEQRKFYLLNP
ncbi:MAG: CpXC domain-containing protein, partial [Chloroflexota bacterium]